MQQHGHQLAQSMGQACLHQTDIKWLKADKKQVAQIRMRL